MLSLENIYLLQPGCRRQRRAKWLIIQKEMVAFLEKTLTAIGIAVFDNEH